MDNLNLRQVAIFRKIATLRNRKIIKKFSNLLSTMIMVDGRLMHIMSYPKFPEKLLKNPKILKLAICFFETSKTLICNPFAYASKEALTLENIALGLETGLLTEVQLTEVKSTENQNLMYYVAGPSIYIFDNKILNLKSEKDLVKYIISLGIVSIYRYISKELRNDPEILKLVLENRKDDIPLLNLVCRALPGALSNEIIDFLISKNIFFEKDNFLNNKYYILQVAEKIPHILSKVSSELKKDREIQILSLIYHPQFLEIVKFESLQQFLSNYGNKYNIADYSVEKAIKDSDFIKRLLFQAPKLYTLLPDEAKKNKENMLAILENDVTNLIFIPPAYTTNDEISLAKKPYSELFEILDDSSRIFAFFEMIKYYEKILAYVLYVFVKEPHLLDKFIKQLKNSEEASLEMVKIIGNSKQLFSEFLDMISFNQQASQFFSELLTKYRILFPKKISESGNLWGVVGDEKIHVYKFIRGVIGVDVNGDVIEISLDNTIRHHPDAIAEIAIRTGCVVKYATWMPFEMAKEVSRQGTLIIQIEGASMTTYLPENLSLEQYNSLMQVLELCKEMKTIGFTHKPNDLYADDPDLKIKITLQDLIDYCNKMLENQNELGKQNL